MTRFGVRELRQNASEWIRRAHAGKRIEVTRRGEVVAVLGPPPSDGLSALRRAGRLRPASDALAELRAEER